MSSARRLGWSITMNTVLQHHQIGTLVHCTCFIIDLMIRFGSAEEEENKIDMAGRNLKKLQAIKKNLQTEEDGIGK